jgi:UDP-glucose 4-epimerase
MYGTDYPTPDGTCVRDYVDVRHIARAHLAAADSTATLPLAMNVGTGRSGSVREVIKLVSAASGKSDVIADERERRAGDPAFLCADVSLIKSAIGFSSKYSLEESTGSLFQSFQIRGLLIRNYGFIGIICIPKNDNRSENRKARTAFL